MSTPDPLTRVREYLSAYSEALPPNTLCSVLQLEFGGQFIICKRHKPLSNGELAFPLPSNDGWLIWLTS